jgi:hypothetical protein
VLAGSGLSIKQLDFVAHGLTVVTTPIGVQGFERAAAWPFVVAEGAEAFAQEAASLASDAAAAMAREGQAAEYCRLYAPERVFQVLAEAMEAPAGLSAGPEAAVREVMG